jgi:hypothetical protein
VISNAEVVYVYKRNLVGGPSKWKPQLGVGLSLTYTRLHLVPNDTTHNEIYQNIFTYGGFGCAGISYSVSKRFFIDADLMVMVWNAQYLEQKDILPVSHQVRRGADWWHISNYNYLRLGCRFRI